MNTETISNSTCVVRVLNIFAYGDSKYRPRWFKSHDY